MNRPYNDNIKIAIQKATLQELIPSWEKDNILHTKLFINAFEYCEILDKNILWNL